MQPLERKERVCGDISTQMLIPTKNPGEKYVFWATGCRDPVFVGPFSGRVSA